MKKNESLPFLPFALPEIGEEEINNVVECMRSGWLTSGPRVREFEKKFAEYINKNTRIPARSNSSILDSSILDSSILDSSILDSSILSSPVEAISVNSATAGLTIALEACGVGVGDEVITTVTTFSASAMSAVYLGATPVLVDIDPVTMNIDANLIEAAITPRTKAIVPVHFAGLACDMDKIISIARKHNLKVVEDAAHALPCFYNGNIIGGLDTDATVYSFYATKTITTGEGGMIVTRKPDIAARARIMRLHGISTDAFDRYTSTKPKWYYEITAPGYKCNMTDIAASMGLPQLAKADEFQKKRAYIWNKYMEAFADLPIILPAEGNNQESRVLEYEKVRIRESKNTKIPVHSNSRILDSSILDSDFHSHHLFVIRIKDDAKISRDEFILKMSEDYGIGCSVHFIPLNLHPFWQKKLGVDAKDFPRAVDSYKNCVSLPIYTKMTDSDIERVIEAVSALLSKQSVK